MFIYVKYNEIDTGETTLTFKEVGTIVKVKRIAKGFIVLEAENTVDINTIIDAQDPAIEVSQISKELFVEATKESEVVKVINAGVGMRIRAKYSLDDELSMTYKADDSISKVEFLTFRENQINIAKAQRAELGL